MVMSPLVVEGGDSKAPLEDPKDPLHFRVLICSEFC